MADTTNGNESFVAFASRSGPESRPRLSVVTPTYNRAPLLPRAYESLCRQTFCGFEWIIVDDGSTDGTRELIGSWKPNFPLRYFWQINQGMHFALNSATKLAEGELITQLDSDDSFAADALERFDYHWRQLPDPGLYFAVAALCGRPDQSIVGSRFPADQIDSFGLRDGLELIDGADRCAVIRTSVLRDFLFPEFPGEKYLAPGIVWNRLLRRYRVRFVNESLKVVYPAPNQMTLQDGRWDSPRGAFLYHRELALAPAPLKVRLKSAFNAVRFAPLALAARLRQ